MKKKAYIPLVALVVAAGIAAVFLMLPTSAPQRTDAFSTTEAQAATELNVRMPPAPTSSAWSAISSLVLQITQKKPAELPDICPGAESGDFDCYQEYYQKLVKTGPIKDGIANAFADLKARYEKNSYVQSQCHPITHVIGRAAAESFQTVAEAYVYGDSFCWSGYYHGVLETVAHRVGLDNLKKEMDHICAPLNADGRYGFNYYNCVHGMGHGLMAITDDELFRSLTYCDALTGDWEQQSCAGGVYMENIIADGLNHITHYLDPKRPLYPCDQSPDKYKSSCYLMQTSYMLKIDQGNFTQTFAWCREAGDNYRQICFQSLGRDASGRTVSDGPKTHDICMLGANNEERGNCVIGAVKDFISYYHSDTKARGFCNLFDDPLKTICLDTATSYYKSF